MAKLYCIFEFKMDELEGGLVGKIGDQIVFERPGRRLISYGLINDTISNIILNGNSEDGKGVMYHTAFRKIISVPSKNGTMNLSEEVSRPIVRLLNRCDHYKKGVMLFNSEEFKLDISYEEENEMGGAIRSIRPGKILIERIYSLSREKNKISFEDITKKYAGNLKVYKP